MLEMTANGDDDGYKAYKRAHQWPNSRCYDWRTVTLVAWRILAKYDTLMKHVREGQILNKLNLKKRMIDGFICVTWDLQIGKQTWRSKSTKEKKWSGKFSCLGKNSDWMLLDNGSQRGSEVVNNWAEWWLIVAAWNLVTVIEMWLCYHVKTKKYMLK